MRWPTRSGWTGGGLRLGQRPEVGGVLERGRDIPSVVVRDPKPLKDGKMDGVPTAAVTVTSRFARSSAATTSGAAQPLPAISGARETGH
jgi:hypothetical protein